MKKILFFLFFSVSVPAFSRFDFNKVLEFYPLSISLKANRATGETEISLKFDQDRDPAINGATLNSKNPTYLFNVVNSKGLAAKGAFYLVDRDQLQKEQSDLQGIYAEMVWTETYGIEQKFDGFLAVWEVSPDTPDLPRGGWDLPTALRPKK